MFTVSNVKILLIFFNLNVLLKKAGLVKVNAGLGGAHLLKSIENITLFDVYKAVDVVEDGHLFQIHKDTDQECIMG